MRIGLVSLAFLPNVGGMEWKVHYLASEYTRHGHEVEVFAARTQFTLRPIPIQIEPSYKIHRCGFPLKGSDQLGIMKFFFVEKLLRRQHTQPFNVLHCHHVGQPTGYGLTIKRLTRVPVVSTPCGGDVQYLSEIGYGERCKPRLDRLIRRNLKRVDVVIAISSSIRAELEQLGTTGRIVDIPNGLPWEMFQCPRSRVLHERLGLGHDALVVLSVGRNEPVKGFRYAVEAFAKVAYEFPQAVYVFLGRKMEPLKQLAAEKGLASRIRFCEQVPMSQLPEVFHSADVFFSSSLLEGFSQVNVQAMAAGLPCIFTDVPGNRDAGMNGGALLAGDRDVDSMADCLARLLRDVSLRERLGCEAHEASKRYDWSRIAEEYLGVFEEVTGR